MKKHLVNPRRAIEYRAWDIEVEKMLSWEDNKKEILDYLLSPDGKLVLMEYSGLRDAIGNKIFEGDFIKSSKFDIPSIVRYYDHTGAFLSGYGNANDRTCLVSHWAKSVEVIGNEFEQPELYKQ